MSETMPPREPTMSAPSQPSLKEMMARYLSRQAESVALGLGAVDPTEVLPYEAGPVQPVDPRTAWDAGLAALQSASAKAPPGWGQLVAQHEPVVAVALCVGNFPQMVRDFHMLLHGADLTQLLPNGGRIATITALNDWLDRVKAVGLDAVLALAACRLSKQFERGEALIGAAEANIPTDQRTTWDNEKAAFLWHQGKHAEARAVWDKLPATLPVRFNRGMADLFLGNPESARGYLSQAADELPETSPWHHLARLYLALIK